MILLIYFSWLNGENGWAKNGEIEDKNKYAQKERKKGAKE